MNSFFIKACILFVINIGFILNTAVNYIVEKGNDSLCRENNPAGLIIKGKKLLDKGEFDSLDLLLKRINNNYYGQLKSDPVINSEYDLLNGKYLNITGNNDAAINIFERLKSENEKAENKNYNLLIQIHNELGNTNYKNRNYEEAKNHYLESLRLYNKYCNNNMVLIDILSRIINVYIYQDNIHEGREYFNKCVYLIDSLNYPVNKELFDSYIVCSLYYSMIWNIDKATEYLNIAENILASAYNSTYYKYCILYYYQGRIMMLLGKLDKALVYFDKSLRMAEMSAALSKFIYLNPDKLALIFFYKKEYAKSNEYFLESLKFIKNTGFSPDYTYYNIGDNYSLLNEFNKAEYYYNLAEREAKSEPDKNKLALFYIYFSKSLLYKKMKEFDREKKYLNMAHDAALKNNVYRNREMSLILRELGRYYSRHGEYKKALDTIQKSLIAATCSFNSTDIYENPGFEDAYDKNELTVTFIRKAYTLNRYFERVTNSLKDIEAGLECYKLASRLEEQVCSGISDENSKIIQLSSHKITLNNCVSTAMKIYKLTNNYKYMAEAFDFSEKSKAVMLATYINEEKAKKFAGIPDSLINYEQGIKNEIAGLNFRINAVGEMEHGSSSEIDAIKSRLFELERKEEELIGLFENEFPEYYDLKYNMAATPVELIRSELEKDQALIEYTVTKKALYTFIVTRDTITGYMQERPDSLSENIIKLRKLLTGNKYGDYNIEDYTEFVRISNDLYKILLEPVVSEIRDKRLIIVPDEVLNLIPFEVLITGSAPASGIADFGKLPYLIKEYSVSYAYSASLLMNRGTRKYKKDRLIAFVPVYKDNFYAGHRDNDTDLNDMLRLYPLSGTKEEVNIISKLYKGRIYENKRASEENFKKFAGNYNIIHMAMHTVVDDKNPMYSKMVFTLGEDSAEDGLLHTFEIFGIKLNASLVVLSGCNTGYGKIQKGEGLLSLARGFVFSGCSGLLLTQWSVADKASLELMKNFYTHLAEGLTKDRALQLAKIDFLGRADPVKTHPYYWAGYIVFGNTSPVPPKKSITGKVIAATLLLLAISAYFLSKRKTGNSKNM